MNLSRDLSDLPPEVAQAAQHYRNAGRFVMVAGRNRARGSPINLLVNVGPKGKGEPVTPDEGLAAGMLDCVRDPGYLFWPPCRCPRSDP